MKSYSSHPAEQRKKAKFSFFDSLLQDKLSNNDPNNRETEKKIHSRRKRQEIIECPFSLVKSLWTTGPKLGTGAMPFLMKLNIFFNDSFRVHYQLPKISWSKFVCNLVPFLKFYVCSPWCLAYNMLLYLAK